MGVRTLYLVRHAEPGEDGTLTTVGRHQAALLGQRLSPVTWSSFHCGPAARTTETAHLLAAELDSAPDLVSSAPAGDYVPCLPNAGDLAALGPAAAARAEEWLGDVSPDEAAWGAGLADEAIDSYAGPVRGDRDTQDLVVTHAFTVGLLVSHALGAPRWRWLGQDFAHAALTAIRYADDRPACLLVLNDMSHLPVELRWTGFPDRWGV